MSLTGQAKTDFDLAVGKAENQKKVLKDKYEEVKLQQEINDLKSGGKRKHNGAEKADNKRSRNS